jgi:hypothetical protein
MSHGGYTYKVQRKNACQGMKKKKQPGEVPNGDSDLARMNGRFNCRHEEINISINGLGVAPRPKHRHGRNTFWYDPIEIGGMGKACKNGGERGNTEIGAASERSILRRVPRDQSVEMVSNRPWEYSY